MRTIFLTVSLLFISILGFSQTVTTTINYTGFLACGGCAVCGGDYYCFDDLNDGFPAACNNTATCGTKTFIDPVPAGNVVTSITVNYYSADCSGYTMSSTIDGNTVPNVNDGNTGCLCSSNPCGITGTTSSTFPCGMPGYVYGGVNSLQLCVNGVLCINKIVLTITYTNPGTITPTITGPLSFCAGGNTTLNAGAGYLGYSWSTGANTQTITVSTAGTYSVTVTSSTGCTTGSASATVTVNPPPTITATATPSTVCAGQSTTLNASGASTYVWNPGAIPGASIVVTPGATQTYTVTGTSASGCTNTQTVTVTVGGGPAVLVSPTSTTFCNGGSVTLNASGATTYTWSPGALSGASVTVSPGATTTYTVTGTTGGCSNTATSTVTVNALPTIVVSPSPASMCVGGSATLNASGASTYGWSPGALSGSSVTVSPGGTQTYTVTGTDINGCVNTQTVTVNVNPLPTIVVSPPTASYCAGAGSATFTASGASTYTWNPGALSGSSVTVSPGATQTYTVTGTDVNGCVNTQTATVTVNPLPTISVNPPSPGICPGGSATLTASGASTYTWNPGALSGSTVTLSPGATQTYTVTGTDINGCVNTQTVTITVGSLSVSAASAVPPTVCSGSSTTITASGATSYTWNPGALSGSSITVSPGSTTTYTLVGSSGGCTDTILVPITVNTPPTVTLTSSTTNMCPGDTSTLMASGASTYTWSPSTNLSSTTGATVTANPPGSTTYIVTGTDVNGCTGTASVTINVNPLVVTPSSSAVSICNGSSTTLTVSGATNYVWTPATGLSATTGSSVIANPNTNTVYSIVGTTTGACKDSITIAVTVNPLPTITATATDSNMCSGTTSTLNASGASTYVWNPGGLPGASVTVSPTVTTTYTVIGTDLNGCDSNATITITINPSPTITVSLAAGDTICPGQTATLNASGATTYTWSPAGGLSCTNCPSPIATIGGQTTYTVTGINGTCTDTASVTLYVPKPIFLFLSPPDSLCAGRSVQIGGFATGGKPSYTYSWNNGLGTGQGPFTVTPGTSTYYVCTVKDACGDSLKDSVNVTVIPSPVAGFIPTPDTIPGGQYVAFVNTSTGSTSWYWTFGNGATSVDTFPYYQYTVPGTYIVRQYVQNGFGCKDSMVETVYVTEGIVIPNVFTPNGDGHNDVFHVTADGMQTYDIEIFNRWGEKVFEANSPEIDWTGRSSSGVEEADGTFYYKIVASDYKGKQYNLDGYLQLIRGNGTK